MSSALALPHGHTLTFGRPLVMGIVNVTPDSFSDGGINAAPEQAVAHGERLAREGARILDIGGESTRPRATPVAAEDELARVLPVIRGLAPLGVPISIDTMKATVAEAAITAGASIVNDVWAFQHDPDMAEVVAQTGAAAVLMHNRGHAGVDPDIDIIADILDFLARSIDIAERAGIARARLIVDPGFGFGKTDKQNFRLIRELPRLASLGCPVLLGVSRKSTIGRLTGQAVAADRLAGSLAAGLAGARMGAAILRVHDVAEHVQALAVAAAIEAA
jgi:dihydropteroate synthase